MAAFKLSIADLAFVLKQIKVAEAHSEGRKLTEIYVDALGNTHDANGVLYTANSPGVTLAIPSPLSPIGLRTVNGSFNNLVEGREFWGAADQVMPRLLPSYYRNEADGETFDNNGPAPGGLQSNTNYANNGNVVDNDPRMISNLIVDMSFNNPAAIVAALTYSEFYGEFAGEMYGPGGALETIQEAFADLQAALDASTTQAERDEANATFDALIAGFGVHRTGSSIHVPNIAPDEGLSVPYNAWMTFFGQFFDHGLDLINKGGNGTVYIPLSADDPLMTRGADGIAGTGDELSLPQNAHLAFMVLTRATPSGDSEVNQTTPFVDQNQTYTSNASHQVFLREYHVVAGRPVATGHLLDGSDANETVSSLPTWGDVKAQALNILGIRLTDKDVGNIPVLRVDEYGEFVRGPNGMPQILAGVDSLGQSIWVETSLANPIDPSAIQLPVGTVMFGGNVIEAGETVSAARTGHGFLDDIAHNAVPVVVGGVLQQDAGTAVGNAVNSVNGRNTEYDNELLDQHFITGDGRGNENIGLTAVHHIFHSEHNRQVEQQKLTILSSGDEAFINEWLATDVDFSNAQLALFKTMSVAQLNAYLQTTGANFNWDGERLFQAARMATEMQYQHLVFEEFARKIQPNIDVFVFNTNPDINPAIFAEFAHVVYRFGHSMLTENMPRMNADGSVMDDVGLVAAFLNPVLFDNDGAITDDQGAAAILRGMTIERGNEIDEFIVDALRNNLLGLPLDLAAINIARGRDTGMPSLNQARQALFDASGSTFLEPYDNWIDFAGNLKNPVSVINFIAAYGTHSTITSATTAEAKRDAAWLLVMGGAGAPADRMDFLTATGAYTNKGGLNEIDLWIGGLAEKKMPFGGFLGSTFNAVFELQLENLQDGDRFYYLTRTQGQNFLVSLEQNSFAKMMMANTDLALPGADGIRGTPDDEILRHIGVDAFGVYDYVLEVNVANQVDYNEADPAAIAAAQDAVDAAQATLTAATAASDAADAAAATAAANLAAAQAAATSDAVALRTAANTAQAQANAIGTTVELGALLTALVAANATDAQALQAAANAAQALANATDAAALQAAATAAAADDAAAAAAQTLAEATDATALQAAADAAAADDAASAAADAAAVLAAQAEADALAARDSAQAALDLLIANAAPQVDIDAATVVRDNAQSALDAAVLASDAADTAAANALTLANATDAAALQAAATAAAADDAAAAAAQTLANATDAAALQAAATQAAADDAAAVAAQAAATAASSADAGVMTALNAYITALAADQAADAAAASADALADAAEAADAALAVAAAAATAANSAAATATAAEAAALAALNAAQADLAAASVNPAGKDPVGNNPVLEAAGLGKVIRDDLSTPGADANYIRVQGGEHVVVGGTLGNDTIITDFGDDGIWGDAGDDRIESGAGVDLVNGGSGNDILTDSGDTGDFIKGDEGDDVIMGGNGLDIYMGGDGKDVVFMSVDTSETFAGAGNDFVLGGDDVDVIMGNEGDDWIEGGAGFDSIAGDMSELFFDSQIIGHDVMFAGSEEQDFDAESGDDIMVQGESVIRNEGMFGFDWSIYKGVQTAADADLARKIFTTEIADVLRNRFDKVEALSGWNQDDLLVGDDRVVDPALPAPGAAAAGLTFVRDDINAAGIARIAGLNQIITANEMQLGTYTAEFGDQKNPNAAPELIFSHGNVLIGGAGDDVLIGKGGDDILDGDRWLNVRIRITQPGQDNTAANQIATIDSLEHVFTAQDAANPSWIGKSVAQLMIDRVIVPDQLHIVREIINEGAAGNLPGDDVDTAVFWDTIDNYTVTRRADGTVVVSHTGFGNSPVPQGLLDLGFRNVSDGVDTLRNIEQVRFGDGLGGFQTFSIGQIVPFAATGTPVISDTTPLQGQTLTANTSSIADVNGLGTFSFQWQRSANNGNTWQNIAGATNQSFALPDAAGTALGQFFGDLLRVVVTFTDGIGDVETLTSAATSAVGINYTAAGNANGVTFSGRAGDDVIVGSNQNDTFTGMAGADTISGLNGADSLTGGNGDDVLSGGNGADNLNGGADNDILSGGDGNDILGGGTGIDRADFTGSVLNYTVRLVGTDVLVNDTVGTDGNDTVRNVETLRFGAADYNLLTGTNGNNTLNGLNTADYIMGGQGNDTINAGDGDDFISQTAVSDGRDFVDGGAGVDTYTLHGVGGGAETFRIYTRAAWGAVAGNDINALNANTEIVITRDGTGVGSIIAELDNIEEIRVNSLNTTANNGNNATAPDGGASGGDSIVVIGDFTSTSLDYNTIRVQGTSGNDTIDITGLTSAHRLVFESNGGLDTILGDVRTQDIFNGDGINDLRTGSIAQAGTGIAPTVGGTDLSDFGSSDVFAGLSRAAIREMLADQLDVRSSGSGLHRLDLRYAEGPDLSNFMLIQSGQSADLGRTMVDMGLDIQPLDLVTPADVQVSTDVNTERGAFDHRFLSPTLYDILPF